MEKLKEYQYIILIVLAVLGFVFYWYEYRPSQIKKECTVLAINRAIKRLKETADYYPDSYKGGYLVGDYENAFKKCLREKGL